MLLVPIKSKEDDEWSMYSVLNGKFSMRKLFLPPYDKPFSGSSEGWLVTLDESLAVTLYKPFVEGNRKPIIHLPPVFPPDNILEAPDREFQVFKVASYTPDPIADPNDVILAVIFGEYSELAYIRPTRDTTWTRVTGLGITTFDDIVYYKGQFYALSYEGELVSFDVTNPSKSNMRLVLAEDSDKYYFVKRGFCYKKYLVKSYGGELLLVRRYLDRRFGDIDRVTKTFKVFKLSFDGPRWIEMKSLGDMALFVGDNASTSVSASNFPGCLKNCIYFTHDKNSIPIGKFGPCDLGVYNLETRRVTLRFTIDDAAFPKMRGRAPIWVLPTYISD